MTSSLQSYRHRIGAYQQGSSSIVNPLRPKTCRTKTSNSFRPRLGASLLIYSYIVLIIFLANTLEPLPAHDLTSTTKVV